MNQKQLIKKFYAINSRLYRAAKRPLRCHGPDHHARVCIIALDLAKKYKQVDYEILIAACFLHDLAAYAPDEVQDRYHEEDWRRARKVLLSARWYPKEKIAKVVEAIASHGSSSTLHRKGESIEATLLRDADKLEALGAVGVARIIMARTRRGDALEDIVCDFYHEGHLRRKWQSIKTPEARRRGRKDYEYARDFFREVAKRLSK